MNEDAAEYLKTARQLKHDDEQKNMEARRLVEFIRPEIMGFAEAMELTMRKHDGKKGDSWKDCKINCLYMKLDEEFKEVENSVYRRIHKDGSIEEITSEIVDLSNVCMMIWNRNVVE